MPSFPAWDASRPARSGLWPLELPCADEQGCGGPPQGSRGLLPRALPWWGDHPARGTGLWGSPPHSLPSPESLLLGLLFASAFPFHSDPGTI